MSINIYLTHLVDIVTVKIVREARGDRLASKSVIYFKVDQGIGDEDEIIVDGFQRAISGINRARNASGIHHLVVTLQ